MRALSHSTNLNPANRIFSTFQEPQIKVHFITKYLTHNKELCMT